MEGSSHVLSCRSLRGEEAEGRGPWRCRIITVTVTVRRLSVSAALSHVTHAPWLGSACGLRYAEEGTGSPCTHTLTHGTDSHTDSLGRSLEWRARAHAHQSTHAGAHAADGTWPAAPCVRRRRARRRMTSSTLRLARAAAAARAARPHRRWAGSLLCLMTAQPPPRWTRARRRLPGPSRGAACLGGAA